MRLQLLFAQRVNFVQWANFVRARFFFSDPVHKLAANYWLTVNNNTVNAGYRYVAYLVQHERCMQTTCFQSRRRQADNGLRMIPRSYHAGGGGQRCKRPFRRSRRGREPAQQLFTTRLHAHLTKQCMHAIRTLAEETCPLKFSSTLNLYRPINP